MKSNDPTDENSPFKAKLVLIIFGLGPIVIMGVFLATQGFFNSPDT